jgi:hypothetical protein
LDEEDDEEEEELVKDENIGSLNMDDELKTSSSIN